MNLTSKINRNIYYKYAGIWFFFTFIVMCVYIDSESFPLNKFAIILSIIVFISAIGLFIRIASIKTFKINTEKMVVYTKFKKQKSEFLLEDIDKMFWNNGSKRIYPPVMVLLPGNMSVKDNTFFMISFKNGESVKIDKKNYNNYTELFHFFLSYCKHKNIPIN